MFHFSLPGGGARGGAGGLCTGVVGGGPEKAGRAGVGPRGVVGSEGISRSTVISM